MRRLSVTPIQRGLQGLVEWRGDGAASSGWLLSRSLCSVVRESFGGRPSQCQSVGERRVVPAPSLKLMPQTNQGKKVRTVFLLNVEIQCGRRSYVIDKNLKIDDERIFIFF